MATSPTAASQPHNVPAQFTLRQAAAWITLLSAVLALLTQFGTSWGLILWLLAGVAASAYITYRSWGGLAIACVAWTAFLVWQLMPYLGHPPSANHRRTCRNNLMDIVIALQCYHDKCGSFPPAYVADASGRPMHSWRVLLLPYLEQESLYKRYNFNEPWDGPNNSKLAAHMPAVYRCPSDARSASPTDTSYVVVVGPGTAWPGARGVPMGSIRDGTSNTILVVESSSSGINWMEPRDLHTLQMPATINPVNGQGICSCHHECAQVGFADGSVRTLNNGVPSNTIQALLTISGGEAVVVP